MEKKPSEKNSLEILEELSTGLGLPPDFLIRIVAEQDDWSFVVKAHALLELATCTMLVRHLKQPALEEVLAEKVEMSARIEMLKAVGLVTSSERTSMRALSRLRNRLVHSAHETRFSFVEHLADKDRRKQFAESFGLSFREEDPMGAKGTPQRVEFIAKIPRFAVWVDVFFIVVKAVHTKEGGLAGAAAQQGVSELLRREVSRS